MTPDRDELRELARTAIVRLSAHISQRQLEKILGLSMGYLSKVKAKGNPSTELVTHLRLIANDPKRRLDEVRAFWDEREGNKPAQLTGGGGRASKVKP